MENNLEAPQANKGRLRDWIDPTRIYNVTVPVGRSAFFWGLAVYPIIVIFLLLTPIIILVETSSQSANLSDDLGIVTYCFMLAWVTAAVAICLRRLRYLGMSQRWVWLIVLPGISLVFLLYLLIKSEPSATRETG